MEYIFVTIVLMAALMGAMAIGVVFRGKELKGSCGGVGGPEDCLCEQQGTPKACEIPGAALSNGVGATMTDGVTVYGGS